MNLYINTSSEYCEIALFSKSELLAHNVYKKVMQHSTILHTLIEKTCSDCNIRINEIKAVGVMNGPGSYTGLRIGLAAAKGFCYSLNIPLVLMNKLELCCLNYIHSHDAVSVISCIQSARQGEYFFYLQNNSEVISEAKVLFTEEINELLNQQKGVICLSNEETVAPDIHTDIKCNPISIEFIGAYLSDQLAKNATADIFKAEPFYLKKVHANTPKKRF